MQRLTLTIPIGECVPGDSFKVFGNVTAFGLPAAEVNYDDAITGKAARPFWPLAKIVRWGEGAWGSGPWGGIPAVSSDHDVLTPELYFGLFTFAVIAYDLAGNASSGEPAEFEVFVNSGPKPPRNFKHAETVAGRPVFSFTPSGQLGGN